MTSLLFSIPKTERERQQFIQRRKSKLKETSIQRDFKGSEASWQKSQDHSPSGEDWRGLALLWPSSCLGPASRNEGHVGRSASSQPRRKKRGVSQQSSLWLAHLWLGWRFDLGGDGVGWQACVSSEATLCVHRTALSVTDDCHLSDSWTDLSTGSWGQRWVRATTL